LPTRLASVWLRRRRDECCDFGKDGPQIDALIVLAERRSDAAETLDLALSGSTKSSHLQWLERQLNALILELDGMLVDLESGLSITDLGFTAEEFAELVDDLERQIQNLRGLVRQARGVAR
jgi:methyl-accepting chemotaxis protein